MSQVAGKFVQDNAIDDLKIRLRNNQPLRARNFANSGDVNIFKVNASDRVEFSSVPQATSDPSVANDLARKSYVDSVVSAQKTWATEAFTLTGTDITNQYVDLAQVIIAGSSMFIVDGLIQIETVDYDVDLTGGAGGKTRISFSATGDLGTGQPAALVAGDIIYIKYQY